MIPVYKGCGLYVTEANQEKVLSVVTDDLLPLETAPSHNHSQDVAKDSNTLPQQRFVSCIDFVQFFFIHKNGRPRNIYWLYKCCCFWKSATQNDVFLYFKTTGGYCRLTMAENLLI